MRLSFSTRGWKERAWTELEDLSSEMGFEGIELYNPQDNEALLSGPLSKRKIVPTLRDLREKDTVISCIDTSCDLSREDCLKKLWSAVSIAEDLGCEYVCAFASEDKSETILKNLNGFISKNGKTVLLIKTSGIYSDTAKLRDLLDSLSSDRIAVVWDIHHPYRDKGESPSKSIENLGAYVRHVHIRDSRNDGSYCMIGEGSFPIKELLTALGSIDYDGFLSLEWKPDYNITMTDPYLIFPYFVNYMAKFEKEDPRRSDHLFPNHDGTGWYVWKKDELIDLTFPKVLERMAAEFPDQNCIKYTTLDYTRTYSEFAKEVDDFSRALVALGVRSRSKVSIWATNVPEWYLSFWACARIGAVLVTVNTAYKIHEAEYLLRQSDTHTLIMIEKSKDSNYREIIHELCPELDSLKKGESLHSKKLPFLRNVITVGYEDAHCLNFKEAMALSERTDPSVTARMAEEVKPDDVCNMQYTSGTTGFPKGVMLTHYNVVNNGKCIGDRMGLSTADRMMIQVPMFHCFGMVLSMTSSLTHGATICPMPYFSAKSSLACINQEHITCFNGVPTMFIAMFNHPDYRKTDFSHMRTGIMAGAGCPPDLMRRAAQPDEMNMRGIVSVYGQTESSPGSTMSAWTDSLDLRCDTVGYPFPHVQCKVIDPETGETLPAGKDGEFCSRGYNTMKGYYKMPEATAKAIDGERWLHSGDIARMDEDGNYRITGRLKDMIIRGGENLYPKEIEEFIYTHPAVSDVQVIGVPDEKYGEEALACIILKEGFSVSEEEMRDFIKKSLAAHKVPRYIRFVDSFPMNAAGKVLKYKMREEWAQAVAKLSK